MIRASLRRMHIKEIHWNLAISHPPLVLQLTSRGQIYRRSRTQTFHLSRIIFGSQNLLIPNFLLFLSHRQRTILTPQDSFQDTKSLSHCVIIQRYRSLLDFVAVQSCSIYSFTQVESCSRVSLLPGCNCLIKLTINTGNFEGCVPV